MGRVRTGAGRARRAHPRRRGQPSPRRASRAARPRERHSGGRARRSQNSVQARMPERAPDALFREVYEPTRDHIPDAFAGLRSGRRSRCLEREKAHRLPDEERISFRLAVERRGQLARRQLRCAPLNVLRDIVLVRPLSDSRVVDDSRATSTSIDQSRVGVGSTSRNAPRTSIRFEPISRATNWSRRSDGASAA